jgi:SAM-dependent methyltransferase
MHASNLYSWEEAVLWLVSQPDQQDLVRDCYYDSPIEAVAERYWNSEEWAAVRAFLPHCPGTALDIGAGRGISSYALARDGWVVTALEPDPSAVVGAGAIRRLASSQRVPISVVQAVGESIPCSPSHFDLVFARQALHHANNLRSLCAEAARMLKPGGIFVAIREHVISKPSDLPRFFAVHPLHKLYGGENALLLEEYVNAIKAGGLVVDRVIRPLESPINFAPLDEKSLRKEIFRRIGNYPGGQFICVILNRSDLAFRLLVKLLMLCDHRPGRLYSFVCRKPDLGKSRI